ncbi:MAG: NAD(P)H-binding protein [Pirellulales bacterium]
MHIVILGGGGLIGGKLTPALRALGHTIVTASPRTGVNSVTGEGLDAALVGAEVVVDVTNSPSFADDAVLAFFTASTGNLLKAERAAGVRHHVALTIVGAERLPGSGYMRAKIAQEELIRAGGVPYTIVRATQFYEFLEAIAASGAEGDTLRLSSALLQPIAADDVVKALVDAIVDPPASESQSVGPAGKGTWEVAGPEPRPLATYAGLALAAKGDTRRITADPQAAYFGEVINDRSLTAAADARIGAIRFEEWQAGRA